MIRPVYILSLLLVCVCAGTVGADICSITAMYPPEVNTGICTRMDGSTYAYKYNGDNVGDKSEIIVSSRWVNPPELELQISSLTKRVEELEKCFCQKTSTATMSQEDFKKMLDAITEPRPAYRLEHHSIPLFDNMPAFNYDPFVLRGSSPFSIPPDVNHIPAWRKE